MKFYLEEALVDRPKPRGILARMKRLEMRVRSLIRRVNAFATGANDSIGEQEEKIEALTSEVTRLKHKVTSLDLWRHKMGGKKPTPPPDDEG